VPHNPSQTRGNLCTPVNPTLMTSVHASGKDAWPSHSTEGTSASRSRHIKHVRPHHGVTQYMDGLQRVVNDYQPPIRRRTEEGAKVAPQGNSDDFANEGNLDSCIAYLSSSLSGELRGIRKWFLRELAGKLWVVESISDIWAILVVNLLIHLLPSSH